MPTVSDVLRARRYPGRGIVVARTRNGEWACCYFLTGRSAASQQRHFVADDGGVLVVDSRLDARPDVLRHYRAIVRRPGLLLVGNGDQVEPFADDLEGGMDAVAVWGKHTYEPDPPIFTPRVLAALEETSGEQVLRTAQRRRSQDRDYRHHL